MAADGTPERLDLEVPAVAPSLVSVRTALRAWLVAARVADDVADDLTIATNEAVANAIEHGSCDTSATVRICATRTDGRVSIEVSDSGCADRPRGDHPERGRGVAVMRALTDSFHIDQSTSGTTVRLERVF